mmetsp:Transcript_14151/g.21603  ORF Transcript_14151/g.21603 Transcript_14151/m.21603 type:complete len:129 (-) Transcript_14151:1741-2127(-)|eukprot:CAMPEP_0178912984 /NCGR_PEP_ID=MMETSP0786-20121207/10581_1 /TAXON_ID=186022 /ORGANISM="Thalassionema frauenfeldii, Strain CCMP 1798" /LENGTH=128 /DNA_ID=CAMNT_0020585657 /DNA_START=261 /DNA_END=647 /DNA_ORIENTATION=+
MIRLDTFVLLFFVFWSVSGFQISTLTSKTASRCHQDAQSSESKYARISLILDAEPPQEDNEIFVEEKVPKLRVPKIGFSMPSLEDNKILPLVATLIAFVVIQKVGLLVAGIVTPEISVEDIQKFGQDY